MSTLSSTWSAFTVGACHTGSVQPTWYNLHARQVLRVSCLQVAAEAKVSCVQGGSCLFPAGRVRRSAALARAAAATAVRRLSSSALSQVLLLNSQDTFSATLQCDCPWLFLFNSLCPTPGGKLAKPGAHSTTQQSIRT